jgi:hypothetical protein
MMNHQILAPLIEPQSEVIASYNVVRGHLPTLRSI